MRLPHAVILLLLRKRLPPAEALTDEIEYAEYAGYQFSGTDPREGTLTITVGSILDGKMEWIFTDSFEDHTL